MTRSPFENNKGKILCWFCNVWKDRTEFSKEMLLELDRGSSLSDHPRCKKCKPGGFYVVGGPTLSQPMLDSIAGIAHPRASNLTRRFLGTKLHEARTGSPSKEKQFRGRDRVSVTYAQLAHSRYLMKNLAGLAPRLEGQCFRQFVFSANESQLMKHFFSANETFYPFFPLMKRFTKCFISCSFFH